MAQGVQGSPPASSTFLFCILENEFEEITPNSDENYLQIDEINSRVCIKTFKFG